jgi:hypothetical protein
MSAEPVTPAAVTTLPPSDKMAADHSNGTGT